MDTTRQTNAQIGTLVEDYINISLREINEPAWAFPRKENHHLWNFLRRKTTFATVASTEDYLLPRDVDKIALIRQLDTPAKLYQITDEQFFKYIPDPTETGNPRFYRTWETDGVKVKLAEADTVEVSSSSSADTGTSAFVVRVSGYDSNGIWRSETIQLSGTTVVSGTITFAAGELLVSKYGDTTGTITVREASADATLVTLGPDDRTARFKVITLYPKPSAVATMYLEYYRPIPELEHDVDVPLFDSKWHYVPRLGALAKVYQYLNKENEHMATQALYAQAVRSMVASDTAQPDLVEYLDPQQDIIPFIRVYRSEDTITVS